MCVFVFLCSVRGDGSYEICGFCVGFEKRVMRCVCFVEYFFWLVGLYGFIDLAFFLGLDSGLLCVNLGFDIGSEV